MNSIKILKGAKSKKNELILADLAAIKISLVL